MTTFVDTSAFYAILSASDSNHGAAATLWTSLIRDQAHLITSNYVVAEACALLQNRLGTAAVASLVSDILPVVTVRWVDPAAHDQALTALCRGTRSGPSLVDRTSFEIARAAGVDTVFAFDQHFAAEGFTVLGI